MQTGQVAQPGRSRAKGPALVDTVYEAVLGLLMDEEIPSGAPLRTEALGGQLGVSATPVREALSRLERTGLVERSARRGWRAAARPSRTDLVHMVDVRLMLEPESTRLACASATDALRTELAELVARQAAAPTGPDYRNYREFLHADWTFHLLMASRSGNPYLEKAFNATNGYWQRYLLFEGHVVTDSAESTAEHQAVLDAFERRSPEIAAAAMRDHLQKLRHRILLSGDGGSDPSVARDGR